MNKEIKEAIEAVDKLNEMYHKQTKDEMTPFYLVYADWYLAIKAYDNFLVLWDNENIQSKIIWDDNTGEELSHETILECATRNYKEFQDSVKKFKLK